MITAGSTTKGSMITMIDALKALIKRMKPFAPSCKCKLHSDVVCVGQACCRKCAKVPR